MAILAGIASVTGQTSAQSPDAVSEAGGADLLREFLAETRTIQANFFQELIGPDEEVIELASGSLSIKRPGRFLWRYAEPIEQQVVADGTNLWIYDVELEQATVTLLDEVVAATPAMLLSGEATLDAEFDVLESFDTDDIRWVRLAPKIEGSDFREVLIGFRDDRLSQLQLFDSLDQLTTIEFVDIEVNMDVPDAVFDFVPPSGVDVIGEAG